MITKTRILNKWICNNEELSLLDSEIEIGDT